MPSNGAAAQTATQENLYRIGEVSRLTDLKPFVLRYWETEFPMLEPVKSASGHRLYRQEDVDMVLRIKRLLYDEGFTIAGARRHLREHSGGTGAEDAGGEISPDLESRIPIGSARMRTTAANDSSGEGVAQLLNRKMLLDLRDTLRAFLTLLERR